MYVSLFQTVYPLLFLVEFVYSVRKEKQELYSERL